MNVTACCSSDLCVNVLCSIFDTIGIVCAHINYESHMGKVSAGNERQKWKVGKQYS